MVKGDIRAVKQNYSDIGRILRFCSLINAVPRDSVKERLDMCTEKYDKTNITGSLLLRGSYLILYEHVKSEHIAAALSAIGSHSEELQGHLDRKEGFLTISDYWQAIETAKDIGWMKFTNPSLDAHIFLEANWGMRAVVPSEILIIYPRHFLITETSQDSSQYKTDIFARMDIRLAVRCRAPTIKEVTWAVGGFEIEELSIDAHQRLPAAAAHLIALSHLCPGRIALDCGEDLGLAEALVSSYLVGKYGFERLAAVAWVRMLLTHGSAREAWLV